MEVSEEFENIEQVRARCVEGATVLVGTTHLRRAVVAGQLEYCSKWQLLSALVRFACGQETVVTLWGRSADKVVRFVPGGDAALGGYYM